MCRSTRSITATAVAALTVAVATGCSASGRAVGTKPSASPSSSTPAGTSAPSTTLPPTASATGNGHNGHLDYTGDSRGGFDVTTGVICTIAGDKLVSVMTSEPLTGSTPTRPSFIATDTGTHPLAMLTTPDGHTYMQETASGMRGHKNRGRWTVTVRNLRIATSSANAYDPRAVTVNGTLTCTHYAGVGTL